MSSLIHFRRFASRFALAVTVLLMIVATGACTLPKGGGTDSGLPT
jgi:hypothetical protein